MPPVSSRTRSFASSPENTCEPPGPGARRRNATARSPAVNFCCMIALRRPDPVLLNYRGWRSALAGHLPAERVDGLLEAGAAALRIVEGEYRLCLLEAAAANVLDEARCHLKCQGLYRIGGEQRLADVDGAIGAGPGRPLDVVVADKAGQFEQIEQLPGQVAALGAVQPGAAQLLDHAPGLQDVVLADKAGLAQEVDGVVRLRRLALALDLLDYHLQRRLARVYLAQGLGGLLRRQRALPDHLLQ